MAIFVPNTETLLGVVNDILVKESIAYRVGDIQPLINGSIGVVFGSQRDHILDKLEVFRETAIPEVTTIRSALTQEVYETLCDLYKEDAYEHIARYMVDDLIYKIDERFITMLRDRAKQLTPLSFPVQDYKNRLSSISEVIMLSVNKSLSDFALSDNRSPRGFAIVSSDIASILSVTTTMGENDYENSSSDSSPSFIGTFAGCDYYVDYTHDNTVGDNIILGTKSSNKTKGSAIISPFKSNWDETNDAETGDVVYFLHDRTGMTINPVDNKYWNNGVGESQYIGKISVDLDNILTYLLFKEA